LRTDEEACKKKGKKQGNPQADVENSSCQPAGSYNGYDAFDGKNRDDGCHEHVFYEMGKHHVYGCTGITIVLGEVIHLKGLSASSHRRQIRKKVSQHRIIEGLKKADLYLVLMKYDGKTYGIHKADKEVTEKWHCNVPRLYTFQGIPYRVGIEKKRDNDVYCHPNEDDYDDHPQIFSYTGYW